MPVLCDEVLMARLEAPLGASTVIIEHSNMSSRNGVCIARTLVRARPRIPAGIMNVANQDQVLSEGTTIEKGESAVWAAAISDQKPQP